MNQFWGYLTSYHFPDQRNVHHPVHEKRSRTHRSLLCDHGGQCTYRSRHAGRCSSWGAVLLTPPFAAYTRIRLAHSRIEQSKLQKWGQKTQGSMWVTFGHQTRTEIRGRAWDLPSTLYSRPRDPSLGYLFHFSSRFVPQPWTYSVSVHSPIYPWNW